MKSEFINKENNTKLILFFNGWGMDESVVKHIDASGFDICVFSHYDNDFTIDIELIVSYSEVILIAWSMGVWAAAKTLFTTGVKINKSIAINGTLSPVDDNNGIPISIFKGTIDNFSERNKQKFDRRMHASMSDNQKFKEIESSRLLEDQLDELKLIYDLAMEEQVDSKFDKAIVGTSDLIFPTRNQLHFWKERADIRELELPHFPFFSFNSWTEIVDL